jgi:hypothetical protein
MIEEKRYLREENRNPRVPAVLGLHRREGDGHEMVGQVSRYESGTAVSGSDPIQTGLSFNAYGSTVNGLGPHNLALFAFSLAEKSKSHEDIKFPALGKGLCS